MARLETARCLSGIDRARRIVASASIMAFVLMQLVFIHGPPASGKLTVARELARLTGLPVFHNHLIVDALTPVFAFGTAPFVALREQIWLLVFADAARERQSLIFTFAPERTVRPRFVPDAVGAVEAAGGRVSFVKLVCPPEEIERRLLAPARTAHGKLTSVDQFRSLRGEGAFDHPELPDSGLTLDTATMLPAVAAVAIRDHLKLGQL